MIRITLLATTLIITSLCSLKAQTVPSSCSADQSVYDYYDFDVHEMALEHIFEKNLSFESSVEVPEAIKDIMMDALVSVYNVEGIPASDTVANYLKVSALLNYPDILLDEFTVETDNGNQWAINLFNDVIPTGHQELDSALLKYGFEVTYSTNEGLDYNFTLKSDKYYNIKALVDYIDGGGQDILTYPQYFGLDWPRIKVDVSEDKVNLQYYYDWVGDFLYSRVWEFNVYNDCSVEYVGVTGDALTADQIEEIETIVGIAKNEKLSFVKLFPNPSHESLSIQGVNAIGAFEIRNALGQLVKTGSSSTESINVSSLQNGVYFLRMENDGVLNSISFIKE